MKEKIQYERKLKFWRDREEDIPAGLICFHFYSRAVEAASV
jgi:hypothetical protein